MVIGPDEYVVFVKVEGVGVNRVFIPIAVIDVEDAAFIVLRGDGRLMPGRLDTAVCSNGAWQKIIVGC